MPNLNNALKKLCSDANVIKETYYGSSHRASFTLNGEKSEWDIFHIGIPFSPQKEAELMRRFGLERDDLASFYGNFEKAVVRHINLIRALNESGIPAIKKSVIEYRTVQYCPRINKDGRQIGQDFYFISAPMETFVGTDIITQRGAYLQDINNLAVRLLQTAKTLSENGVSLGAIDLDSCFYVPDEFGKKYLKLGYCFYSTGPGISPEIYTEDVRSFVPETISNGDEKQSLDSDVRTICAYIWTMLDGKHYTEPNLNAWTVMKFYSGATQSGPANMLPRYAPAEISSLLVEGITRGADAMRQLQTDIRQVNKRIAAGEIPNTFIPFETPSYLQRPLPTLRKDTEEEEPEEVSEKKETEGVQKTDKKKKPRIAGILIAVISLLLLSATTVYLLLGADGIHNILHPVHYSMSSAINVYSANGKVVNDKLQIYSAYTLDEDGNIVKIAEPESILFPKEYVSDYIFVENVKLAIVEKHFSSVWTGSELEPELREEVVDLRNMQDLFYSYAADAVNEIPESVIEKQGIQADSLILISNDPEDPQSYAVVMLVDMSNATDEWEGDSSTVSGDTGDEIDTEPTRPVQEVQYLSDALIYKVQGEWRNKVDVSIEPENAINSRITLISEDPEHMYFVVSDATGKESKTKSIRLSKKDNGEVSFFVVGNTEGKYLIRIESEDGSLNKRIQMTFAPPGDYSKESPPPRPTPTPLPTLEPEMTPSPEPESTPTPTPWVDPYTQTYPGGYTGGDSSGGTEPSTTVDPVETIPETTPAPIYTPEPILPLSCSIGQIELTVGETFRLGDYLDGIEGGYLTAIPSPGGIISINQADGFLLTGLSPGNCVILISKGAESVSVTVTVF